MKPRQLIWSAFYGLNAFIVALAIAWILLASTNFWYGLWHDVAGIAEGIEQYGPKNHFKPGFADTTREQRVEIFSDIVVAIHNRGEGLSSISYESSSSGGRQLLLREPEIIHLQDVANLIVKASYLFGFALLCWLAQLAFHHHKKRPAPVLKHQVSGFGLLLLVLTISIIIFGAESVFYAMHVWVFPAEHQWFFYYQESLMSTMMLAPILFFWIGGAWISLTFLVFGCLTIGCRYWLSNLTASGATT